jgi:predicted nucleic-acid-binding Zn-ribbon protein
MKLYLVVVRCSAKEYSESYVVAEGMDEAYGIVKDFMDKDEIGFIDDRELRSVTLIAETARYPKCGTRLFIKEQIELGGGE